VAEPVEEEVPPISEPTEETPSIPLEVVWKTLPSLELAEETTPAAPETIEETPSPEQGEEIEIPSLPGEQPEAPAPVQALPPEEEVAATEDTPLSGLAKAPRRKPRSWPWVLGSLPLLTALALEGAYLYRSNLAAQYPGTKPYLEQLCAAVGCRVPLPRDPDLLGIETSSLEGDPAHPDVVVLSAALRNRAPYAQAYPSLELTLTDAQDKVVGRRVFAPKEYLPKDVDPSRGMPPNQEVAIKLSMDLTALKAVGYRLYLFYP
jgi:hypothetical protein